MTTVMRTAARGTDSISQLVAKTVVSREPVTMPQFESLVGVAAAVVRTQFELSDRGAREAVRPALRRLCPPTVDVCPRPKRRVFETAEHGLEVVVLHTRTYPAGCDGAE